MTGPMRETVAVATPRGNWFKPQDMEFVNDASGVPGDCVRACTASYLGIDRSAVPHFVAEANFGWRGSWGAWLEERGWAVLTVDPSVSYGFTTLACGPTVRVGGQVPHAHMVLRERDQCIFDPHPSRAGLIGVTRAYVLVPWQGVWDLGNHRRVIGT